MHISGITFIRYAHDQKIGKQNKLFKYLKASKPKGLNSIANIG